MTSIESITPQDGYMLLYELTGADPTRSSAVAELVRHLVSSHSPWRYQSLLGEVTRLIKPVREIDSEEIRLVIEALEADGDLVVNGGAIHATPIRAIRLDGQSLRFMSSLPTKRLADLFPGSWSCQESTRSCQPADSSRIEMMLRERNGALLTPEGWAGLDYEPQADEDWLAGVESRMLTDAFSPESEVFDHRMTWQWLKYGETSLRWEKAPAPQSARLWRGINLRGYWVYALTRSGSPIEMEWLKLARNDAYRAIFALARSRAIPVPVRLELGGAGSNPDTVVLTLPPVLPYAEYRYLTALANSRHSGPHGVRWWLNRARAIPVVEILEKRLCVKFPSWPPQVIGQTGLPFGD